jgi:hypothetical protein
MVGERVHLIKLGQVPGDQRRLAAELLQNCTAPIPIARMDQHPMAVSDQRRETVEG